VQSPALADGSRRERPDYLVGRGRRCRRFARSGYAQRAQAGERAAAMKTLANMYVQTTSLNMYIHRVPPREVRTCK
jgi:hypothetical protein